MGGRRRRRNHRVWRDGDCRERVDGENRIRQAVDPLLLPVPCEASILRASRHLHGNVDYYDNDDEKETEIPIFQPRALSRDCNLRERRREEEEEKERENAFLEGRGFCFSSSSFFFFYVPVRKNIYPKKGKRTGLRRCILHVFGWSHNFITYLTNSTSIFNTVLTHFYCLLLYIYYWKNCNIVPVNGVFAFKDII